MANIFEFLSKDGNITPEKARKSRQMQFRDKTAYVWGLRYRWDPSLSRIPDPRIPHFMPPCHWPCWLVSHYDVGIIKNINQLKETLECSLKMTHFPKPWYYSKGDIRSERASNISNSFKGGKIKRFTFPREAPWVDKTREVHSDAVQEY